MSRALPQFDLEVLDLWEVIPRRKYRNVTNALCALAEYRTRVLRLDYVWMHRGDYSLKTSYFFRAVKQAAAHYFSPADYACTLFTPSIFDVSVPGIPHFVYTDHTHLVNLRYPGIAYDDLRCKWLECERTVYANATRIFAFSHNIVTSLTEQYHCDPAKIVQVNAGSNTPEPSASDVDDLQRYQSRTILFVGIDWDRKGGPELVAAFQRVRQVYPDAQLTIVGCAPRLNIPNCHVVGRVPVEEVAQHFLRAAVFCMPTRLEPFGMVFIEAFQHKLPVVSTHIGAIPEFVHDGRSGYLVEPYTVDQLTQALLNLIADPEKCRRFGEHGFQTIREHYTWDRVETLLRQHMTAAIATATTP